MAGAAPDGIVPDWIQSSHGWKIAVDCVGGFVSGSVSIAVGHPFDTVKVRLQAGYSNYSSAIDCVRSTVRAEGSRALLQGMLPPLLSTSAMNAVTFSCAAIVLRLLTQ